MILVTGGSGFLGSAIVRELCRRGKRVRILDIVEPWDLVNGYIPNTVEFVQADVCHQDVYRAFRDVDTVVHCAASVPLCKNAKEIHRVNYEGTRHVFGVAAHIGVKRFVYISSSAVYGRPLGGNPVTYATRPAAQDPYGESKLKAEIFLKNQNSLMAPPVTIVRPRTVVGPGRLGIFSKLFEWIYRGWPVPVFGKGDNLYQFVSLSDTVTAIWKIVERKYGGYWNIDTVNYCSMRETLQSVIGHAKTDSPIISLPKWMAQKAFQATNSIRLCPFAPYQAMMYGEEFYFGDNDKSWELLNWKPEVSNQQMMCEAYDWYVQNRDAIRSGMGNTPHRRAM